MATNKEVASAWGQGRKKSAANMFTTGSELYSYDLMIGYTTPQGGKVLIDYTANGGRFVSATTSGKHISPSRFYADFTVSADQYDEHGKNAHIKVENVEPLLDPHHAINGEG